MNLLLSETHSTVLFNSEILPLYKDPNPKKVNRNTGLVHLLRDFGRHTGIIQGKASSKKISVERKSGTQGLPPKNG